MVDDNPYESPSDGTAARKLSGRDVNLLTWTVSIVFTAGLVGGVLGLSIGAALGTFVPGYYRSVFPNGREPNFDPVAVGIGQGLTQRLVLGAIVGLALVAMFYWYKSRSAK